jgi:hypothetical protein
MGGGSGCGSRGRGADRCCSVADLVMSGYGKLVLHRPKENNRCFPAQLTAIENRVDLQVHCMYFIIYPSEAWPRTVGYTVIAFNQIEQKRLDPKTHINVLLDPLLDGLRKRPSILFLKRLTIVLDEDSEKGFGLVRHFLLCVIRKGLRYHYIDEWKYTSCTTLRSFSLGTHHSRNILFSMLDPFAAFSLP